MTGAVVLTSDEGPAAVVAGSVVSVATVEDVAGVDVFGAAGAAASTSDSTPVPGS